jgi:hypothetical protein
MPTYVSGQQRDILPEGLYVYTTEDAQLQNSKNGNEQIKLGQRVKDQLIFDYLVFHPNSAFRIDQYRRSYGDPVLPGELVEINPSDLIGKTGKCTVVIETWNGKQRNKIGSYLEPEAQDELSM